MSHGHVGRDGLAVAVSCDFEFRFVRWFTLADDAVQSGKSPLGPLTTVPTTFLVGTDGRIREKLERALAPGELAALLDTARTSP